MPLTHHDRCFGCGDANGCGLHLRVEPQPEGGVAGAFTVTEAHEGAPGSAHGGVVSAALDEVMSLLLQSEGLDARTARIAVDLHMPAPVGSEVSLKARIEGREGSKVRVSASAAGAGGTIGEARGLFVLVGPSPAEAPAIPG